MQGGGGDRPVGIAAPAGQAAHRLQQGQGHPRQSAVLKAAAARLHDQGTLVPAVGAIRQAVGGESIAHQHQLLRRQPLQQHRHRRRHVHAVGDQAQGDVAPQGGCRHRPWLAVMQACHGVEGMGEHAHAGIEARLGLRVRGGAVAQAHHHAPLRQLPGELQGARQLRRQGQQGKLVLVAGDAFLQGRRARQSQVLGWMGSAAARLQEWPLQVGPQQPAAAGAVLPARQPQHRQGAAQVCGGAGHQGGADRFHPVGPEGVEQLQQGGQVGLAELGEGQAQTAVDLQIHRRRAEPIAVPVLAAGGTAGRQRLYGGDAGLGVEAKAPEPLPIRQADVAEPAHGRAVCRGGRMSVSPLRSVPPVPTVPSVSSSPSACAPVAVVMGSDSDLPTMQPAVAMLERLGVAVEVRVLSAHRTPLEMVAFAQAAAARGFKVLIAGAGGAAHLPGMVASLSTLPVIGVPVQSRALSGVDSLHSIVQMPAGIPVATVAIGNGANAGLLAAQILALADPALAERVAAYRRELHDQVVAKDGRLLELGSAAYLAQM